MPGRGDSWPQVLPVNATIRVTVKMYRENVTEDQRCRFSLWLPPMRPEALPPDESVPAAEPGNQFPLCGRRAAAAH